MYTVIELQTTGATTSVVPPVAYSTQQAAESKFHEVMAAAAISSVPIHSCVILDEKGFAIKREDYVHEEDINADNNV